MELLRCIRELGGRMEREESEYKEQLDFEQSEAIREADEAIQALQSQLETTRSSSQATIQAYIKECDTLKLREEVASYQRETSQLGAALAKAIAKIEFLNGKTSGYFHKQY